MSKQSTSFKLVLLAIGLTFIAIAMPSLTPERRLTLSPANFENFSFFMEPLKNDSPSEEAYVVESEGGYHFKCELKLQDQQCNFILKLFNDEQLGVDISAFEKLRFSLKYSGNSGGIHVAMRNFDPRFSIIENPNSSKIQLAYIRGDRLNGSFEIPLQEFVVPDWWRDQFDLPQGLARPDFSNVTYLYFFLMGNLTDKIQDVYVADIELVGSWIIKESWYLGVILLWLFGFAIYSICQFVYLTRKDQQQNEKIVELIVKNSQLEEQTDKFRRLSTVDALTNAFNRYGIEQIVESLGEVATSTSIIIFDIDHFKRVNDRRGHDCGDKVLQKISAIVLAKTRTNDRLGRWGGEEFVLICQDTPIGMAIAIAEKIRILIATADFDCGDPLVVTASFGVATIRPDECFSDALKRADDALYQAKHLGRNCVFVPHEDSPFTNGIGH